MIVLVLASGRCAASRMTRSHCIPPCSVPLAARLFPVSAQARRSSHRRSTTETSVASSITQIWDRQKPFCPLSSVHSQVLDSGIEAVKIITQQTVQTFIRSPQNRDPALDHSRMSLFDKAH